VIGVKAEKLPTSEIGRKAARKWLVLGGCAFLANGFIFGRLADQTALGALASAFGAILLFCPLVGRAYRSLREGRRRMDELVVLAVLASFALGDYTTAGVVALLMLAATALEEHTASGAWTEVESLLKMAPKKARRILASGEIEEVPAHELKEGDLVRVLPGDIVPADGIIREGSSALIEGSITGESLPTDKAVGDRVYAGTVNCTGPLAILVDRVGPDTTLARVKELILSARKVQVVGAKILDKFAGWYPPVAVMVAAFVLFLTNEWNRSIGALVASCPIALVLAFPSAAVASLAACYRNGLLVKKPSDLETGASVNTLVIDKTGTLTFGELRVLRFLPAKPFDRKEVLSYAIAVARQSRHPVSRAFVQWAESQELEADLSAEKVREEPGRGLVGVVSGREVRLGKPDYLKSAGVRVEPLLREAGDLSGHSALAIALDGEAAGLVLLSDRIRPEAKEALEDLRSIGVNKLIMVTGDRREVAERMAEEVGVSEVVAPCLPDQKLKLVEELRAKGHCVVVVGDGVNDAPALASGDIGIALGSGASDITLETADVVVVKGDLRSLPEFLRIGKRYKRILVQNLLIGVVLILSGVTLAGLGYLTPISAAFLQNFGALCVLLSSARLVGGARYGESR